MVNVIFFKPNFCRERFLVTHRCITCLTTDVMCPLFLALQLVQTENVRGVVTMNEVYETKYFCNSAEVSLPVVSRNDGVCPISTDWRASGAKMLQFVWCVLAGVACCRGGTAETEHCRPDRRPQSGKSAPRCWVCPEVPWAGQQCLCPLQSWTLTQCHTGRCLPNPGQSVIIHIGDSQCLQHLLNLIQSMTWKKKLPQKNKNENGNQKWNWICREFPIVRGWFVYFLSSLWWQLHCWTPEEACEKLASIRPHILVRSAQLEMLRRYHQQVCGQSDWISTLGPFWTYTSSFTRHAAPFLKCGNSGSVISTDVCYAQVIFCCKVKTFDKLQINMLSCRTHSELSLLNILKHWDLFFIFFIFFTKPSDLFCF